MHRGDVALPCPAANAAEVERRQTRLQSH
jgi:hypothetical protein